MHSSASYWDQTARMDGFTLAVRIRAHPGLRDTHLFMLTSAGQRGDAARRQQMGIEVYLLKPAKQSALVGAIARSLGQPVPAAHVWQRTDVYRIP